jgi:hypothetical protein
MMTVQLRSSLGLLLSLFLGLSGCGDGGSGLPASGVVVSNATPSSANGTYTLNAVTSNTVAGITQVKIADPSNTARSLQIFYNASSALTSIIYTSPEAPLSLMTCIVGNATSGCPMAAIAFDLPGKKITFTNATFTQLTIGVGTLNGTVIWSQ